MAYIDKIKNKAGTLYDIQDARVTNIESSDVGKFAKVVATTNGDYEISYDTVDTSGAISTHNESSTAHADIRTLVSNEATSRADADTALGNRIAVFENGGAHAVDAIEAKIPSAATSSNQLADKEFVNSSISTETAHYISNSGEPFTSVAQLEAYTGTVTNNDYAFVTGTDEYGNTYYDRYKATVSGSTVTWAKEYRLNNSSFTAAQWATISSGMTSSDKTKLDGVATGATAVTTSTVSGWGFKNSAATTSADGYMTSTQATKLAGVGTTYSFTLPAISAGSTASVTVTGLTADNVAIFGLQPTASASWYAAAANSQLQVISQAANSITVRANGKALASGLPCVIEVIK